MEQLITYLLVAGLGFWAGMTVANIWNRIIFKDILNDLGINNRQLVKLAQQGGYDLKVEPEEASVPTITSIDIKLEQHQGQIYAFRLDNDEFLAQGWNQEDLQAALTRRLNNARFVVSEDNGAALLKKPRSRRSHSPKNG